MINTYKYSKYNEILFIHKKDSQPFAIAWMNLEGIFSREISQTEKYLYVNLKKKKTPINIDNILVVARGGWGDGPIGEGDQKVQDSA